MKSELRFEVLKRDAEIRYWQDVAAHGASAERQQQLTQELDTLDEEFSFIASCNEGGEFMAPALVTRLQQIGARTWQRTLSDRIGISHEEQLRKARTEEPALPTTESLLADKAEHILTRTERDKLPGGIIHGNLKWMCLNTCTIAASYTTSRSLAALCQPKSVIKSMSTSSRPSSCWKKLPFPRHFNGSAGKSPVVTMKK